MRLSCAPAYFGVLLLATAGCGQSGGGGSASTSITFVNESLAGGPTLTSISVNDDGAVGLPGTTTFPVSVPPGGTFTAVLPFAYNGLESYAGSFGGVTADIVFAEQAGPIVHFDRIDSPGAVAIVGARADGPWVPVAGSTLELTPSGGATITRVPSWGSVHVLCFKGIPVDTYQAALVRPDLTRWTVGTGWLVGTQWSLPLVLPPIEMMDGGIVQIYFAQP